MLYGGHIHNKKKTHAYALSPPRPSFNSPSPSLCIVDVYTSKERYIDERLRGLYHRLCHERAVLLYFFYEKLVIVYIGESDAQSTDSRGSFVNAYIPNIHQLMQKGFQSYIILAHRVL